MCPDNTRLPEGGIHHAVVGRQGLGVKQSDLAGGGVSVHLLDDDRLGRLRSQFHELASSGDTLQIEDDDLRFIVIHEIGKVVDLIQIQFVPHTHRLADADVAAAQLVDQVIHDPSALGQHGDGTGL